MSSVPARTGAAFVDLEFDTAARGVAQFGDIASSLVVLDELIRDLASLAATRTGAEFRDIEIAAIDIRNPLKVRLSVFAVSAEALGAFQELGREIIRGRITGADSVAAILARCLPQDEHPAPTDQEIARLHGHAVSLQQATVALTRVRVMPG